MPWIDDGRPVPGQSEDQLLAAVEARAERIRGRRRRIRATGAMAAALAVLGTVAFARAGSDPETQLQVAGVPTTATPGPTAPAVFPLPLATTTVPTAPQATVVPSTVAPVRTTTTTRAVATTTTVPPTTTSTTFVPLPVCTSEEIVVRVVTDRPSYTAAQTVRITATAENRSDRTCRTGDPGVDIRDSGGTVVFSPRIIDKYTMWWFGGTRPQWEPGAVVTDEFTWEVCSSGCVRSPGTYTITAFYGEYHSNPVTIAIT